MIMNTANYGIPCGIGLLVIGLVIRFYIGRRRFDRRNVAGLQQFSSYGKALWISFWEGIALLLASSFMVAGGILLASTAFTHLKF